ncbi:MAG: hypothetical protein D3926_15320 [Desulfobacteraceae bacterium]|nr:MAG: hypothetical protein D3926_15320 [Desulfobacteraceae bacterium]
MRNNFDMLSLIFLGVVLILSVLMTVISLFRESPNWLLIVIGFASIVFSGGTIFEVLRKNQTNVSIKRSPRIVRGTLFVGVLFCLGGFLNIISSIKNSIYPESLLLGLILLFYGLWDIVNWKLNKKE